MVEKVLVATMGRRMSDERLSDMASEVIAVCSNCITAVVAFAFLRWLFSTYS